MSRAAAQERMLDKLKRNLTDDITPILPEGSAFSHEDAIEAFELVWKSLILRIKGDPWKNTDRAIEKLKESLFPGLQL